MQKNAKNAKIMQKLKKNNANDAKIMQKLKNKNKNQFKTKIISLINI